MDTESDADELYRRLRPTKFSQVIGQDDVIRSLIEMAKGKRMPHCILFCGPSGTGKTTLARILRVKLKCSDSDFNELNLADLRGIDEVRKIRQQVPLSPLGGTCRIWLLDEAHKLTNDAQNAFLKLLEDTPRHVYFFLCTTEPNKLIPTIRTRATVLQVKPLGRVDMQKLIHTAYEGETGAGLSEEVSDKIIEVADGSPRKALVLLNQILLIKKEEDQLRAIEAGTGSREAIELARLLLKPAVRWPDLAKVIKGIADVETQAEGIRRLVLAYMSNVALGGGKISARACQVIDCFRDNFFETGKAGLILACWECVQG